MENACAAPFIFMLATYNPYAQETIQIVGELKQTGERSNNTKVNTIIIYHCTFLSSRVSFRRFKVLFFLQLLYGCHFY